MSSDNWRSPLKFPFFKGKVETLFAHSSYIRWIYGLLLFSSFFVLMYLIQFSSNSLVGTDGYYHIKIASLMRTEGLKPEFPWLPLTILNPGEFADHHFLFHVLLIPFTFGDLIQGAKLASIIFASFAFISIWWLLKNQNVSYAGLWALGLFAISEAFLYRMNMPRAQSLSLALLVLGLNFMLVKKYLFLTPLAFVYVWLFDGFPLLLVITLIYIFSEWMIEQTLDLRPLLYVLAGIFLGLLFNPYFPHNIVFIIRHLVPKFAVSNGVRVGNEWYPYETGQLLENSPLALMAFLSGAVALGLRKQRMDSRTATGLFIAIFFLIMLFQSRRYIEYFPPFALIFAALAWDPLISSRRRSESGSTAEFSPIISHGDSSYNPKWTWLVGGILALIIFAGIWFTAQDAQQSIMKAKSANRYSDSATWLAQNTPRGARIFQTDWDDFTRLFYYNTHNTYLIGLDPTYLHLKDPDLFELWVNITRGEEELPSKLIFQQFAAEYVFTDTSHKKFIELAGDYPGLVEVFKDEEAVIFQVVPNGG
jgi:hypothetical protein